MAGSCNPDPSSLPRHTAPIEIEQTMGSIIAIDHGTKKTGFAVADALRIAVQPLEVCHAPGDGADLLAYILKLCEQRDVERFIIGLPKNMDGTEGPRSKAVRVFGEQLARSVSSANLGTPEITFWDERLSTKEADSLLVEAGFHGNDRKSRRDSWAALVILRDWLESHP